MHNSRHNSGKSQKKLLCLRYRYYQNFSQNIVLFRIDEDQSPVCKGTVKQKLIPDKKFPEEGILYQDFLKSVENSILLSGRRCSPAFEPADPNPQV